MVQGEGSIEQVSAALDYFSRSGWAEVVILARGGGSLEDLWTFNEEAVARAIAESPVKAGVLYRKMTASAIEKVALENVSINSDSSNLQMHFKADDKQFQSLMHSDLFAAVSK